MKKLFSILLVLLSLNFAFSQDLEINSVPGGVQFEVVSSGATYSYTNSASLYAFVDQNDKLKFFNKLGGQILGSFLYSTIELNDSIYPTAEYLLEALNELSAFNPSGGNSQNIINVSCADSCSFDSLWTNSSGFYEPTNSSDFKFNFKNNFNIYNDSVSLIIGDSIIMPQLNGIGLLDYRDNASILNRVLLGNLGVIGNKFDYGVGLASSSFNGGSGLADLILSSDGDNSIAYISSQGDIEPSVTLLAEDTITYSSINIFPEGVILEVNESSIFKFSKNGVVFPQNITPPPGEIGAMYFDSINSNFNGFIDGEYRSLSYGGWAQYKDTTYTESNKFSVLAGDTVTIPNNGFSSIESYSNGYDFYNETDTTLNFPLGSAFTLRIDISVEPSITNANFFVYLDIGGSQGIILNSSTRCARGTAAQKYSLTLSGYALSTFVANGGKLKFEGSHDMDIYGINYVITKH